LTFSQTSVSVLTRYSNQFLILIKTRMKYVLSNAGIEQHHPWLKRTVTCQWRAASCCGLQLGTMQWLNRRILVEYPWLTNVTQTHVVTNRRCST
jgi:hypothetical protein